MHGGLAARVTRTDDHDVGVSQRTRLGGRRPIEHAAADERLERCDTEPPIRHSARQDHGVGGDHRAVIERETMGCPWLQIGDSPGEIELSAESRCLENGASAELPAGDPRGKPR